MAYIRVKNTVSASSLNVHDLMERGNYIIPDYQRDYVWKEAQVKQLWIDLFEHYEKNLDKSKREELVRQPEAYFLGAVVVIEDHVEKNLQSVVDGQQRLTTLTCMASVLCEKLKLINEDRLEVDGLRGADVDGLISQISAIVSTFRNGEHHTRIRLSTDINEFFLRTCVLSGDYEQRKKYWDGDGSVLIGIKNSAANKIKKTIEESYNQIDAFLSRASNDEDKIKRIYSFSQLFAESVVLLKIEAGSEKTAYDLFESLNFRGLPLSQADLVKNELIKQAKDSIERRDIINSWADVKNTLNDLDVSMPDFLHYSYLSRYGHIKASKLFESVSERVSSVSALVFAQELALDARAIEQLIEGKFEADPNRWTPETSQMLQDIHHILNIKLAYVSLLAAYRQASEDKNKFASLVLLIMNFVFRFMKVLEGEVDSLSRIMHSTAMSITSGADISVISLSLLEEAPDDRFQERFKSVFFSNAKMSYYVIYYIEKTLLSGTKPLEHGLEQNLEHIMPKVPKKEDWPTVYSEKDKDPDTFREYLWRIGNLIPLPADINKYIKNKNIKFKIKNEKNKDYTSCSLESPKKVPDFLFGSEWTYQSIENRQKYLADNFASKSWKL